MTTFRSNSDETPVEVCPTIRARSPWWRLPLLLGFVLFWILVFRNIGLHQGPGDGDAPAVEGSAGVAASETVSITIEFGDKRKPLANTVPWHEGMTVRGLMASAALADFGQKGADESAFLTEIAGVKNEGAGGRNWMYSVNGQRADRSFAVCKLQPGDHVLWSFEPRE